MPLKYCTEYTQFFKAPIVLIEVEVVKTKLIKIINL